MMRSCSARRLLAVTLMCADLFCAAQVIESFRVGLAESLAA